jgi:hypothetical protein
MYLVEESCRCVFWNDTQTTHVITAPSHNVVTLHNNVLDVIK